MPDLPASLQINPALPALAAVIPLRAAPVSLPGSAVPTLDFGDAFAALARPDRQSGEDETLQDAAGGGKNLPQAEDLTPEPMIMWLPGELAAPGQTIAPVDGAASAAHGDGAGGVSSRMPPAMAAAAPGVADAGCAPQPVATGDRASLPGQAAPSAAPALDGVPSRLAAGASPPDDGAPTDPRDARGLSQPIVLPPSFAAQHVSAQAGLLSPLQAAIGRGAIATAAPDRQTLTSTGATPLAIPQPQPTTTTPPAIAGQTGAASLQPQAPVAQAMPDAMSATPDKVVNDPASRLSRAHGVTAGDAPTQPTLVTLQPQTAGPVSITSGAAAQVFATALSAGTADPRSDQHDIDTALLLAGTAPSEQRQIVQALSAASDGTLDLARDDWPSQMIERIAALRDSAEAADTRIKLAPENLGALEVSIRRDGDRIHVHFTAENPAARQLIADSAPRLAELAEARGVKLGQTSVNGDSQHGAQRDAQQQQQSQSPARNASVATRGEPTTHERIA